MSTITVKTQTENQIHVDKSTLKFLVGFNEFTEGSLTASGADVELTEGLIMGRISATNLLTPCDKDATDGSALPVGVCIRTQTVADGDTETIKLVNKGRIDESFLNFADTETLATPVGPANFQKTYRDHLEDLGLVLENGVELTAVDNS